MIIQEHRWKSLILFQWERIENSKWFIDKHVNPSEDSITYLKFFSTILINETLSCFISKGITICMKICCDFVDDSSTETPLFISNGNRICVSFNSPLLWWWQTKSNSWMLFSSFWLKPEMCCHSMETWSNCCFLSYSTIAEISFRDGTNLNCYYLDWNLPVKRWAW